MALYACRRLYALLLLMRADAARMRDACRCRRIAAAVFAARCCQHAAVMPLAGALSAAHARRRLIALLIFRLSLTPIIYCHGRRLRMFTTLFHAFTPMPPR